MFMEHTEPDSGQLLWNYQPAEYRNTGPLLKRLVNCDVETNRGHKCQILKSMMMMMMMTMIKLLCCIYN